MLGRNFLNGILKGWLPATLRDEFFAEMACVGGMAAPFQTILSEVASRHDFELVRVMRSPIEGLMTFHRP